MKHIIILGDGMADHCIERLGGKTPLQYADTPYMDLLAREGRNGRLVTVPEGFPPGSEVANTAIMGYDLNKVYEGRGPLEAAAIGYEMRPGGNKHITCSPPHDHPDQPWQPLLVRPEEGYADIPEEGRMTASETADLINRLIIDSQQLLANHPFNLARRAAGHDEANSIWPWSPGYRPSMRTIAEMYPQVKSGSVISAVDLIKGIGHYAGLHIIEVEGATGLADTNYEGKAAAAIEALRNEDFVFLHVEASDEAGHDGNLDLKVRTIEYLDHRIVEPIYNAVKDWDETVCIAVLPDHPTPVEIRTHINEPVPFLIWHRGIQPDSVTRYDEQSAVSGHYGMLRLEEFMQTFMNEN